LQGNNGPHLHIVFLGLPGAGKSLQARAAAERLGFAHITLRSGFEREFDAQTPLSRRARPFVQTWSRVPDSIIIPIVLRRLSAPDARASWVTDGFPKTRRQAEAVEPFAPLAILLEVSDDTSRSRCARRQICVACGSATSLDSNELECAVCDGKLMRRDDDSAAYARRYAWRKPHLDRLADFYVGLGRLRRVSSEASPAVVADNVYRAIAAHRAAFLLKFEAATVDPR
jgi:adenylate kinase